MSGLQIRDRETREWLRGVLADADAEIAAIRLKLADRQRERERVQGTGTTDWSAMAREGRVTLPPPPPVEVDPVAVAAAVATIALSRRTGTPDTSEHRRERDRAHRRRFGVTAAEGARLRCWRLVQLVADGAVPLAAALAAAESMAAAVDVKTWDAIVEALDAAAVAAGGGPAVVRPRWSRVRRRHHSGDGRDAETRRSVRRQRERMVLNFDSGTVTSLTATAATDSRRDLTAAEPRTGWNTRGEHTAAKRRERGEVHIRRQDGEDTPRRWTSGVAAAVAPEISGIPRSGGAVAELRPVWAVGRTINLDLGMSGTVAVGGTVQDAAAEFEIPVSLRFGAGPVPSGGRSAGRATARRHRVTGVLLAGRMVAAAAPALGVTREDSAAARGVEVDRAAGIAAHRETGPASPWRVVSVPPVWSPCAACAADPDVVAAGGSVCCPSQGLARAVRSAASAARASAAARAAEYVRNGWRH